MNAVSTGTAALDRILDGLRMGDNVVWRLADMSDYPELVSRFAMATAHANRQLIYVRFGRNPALLHAGPGVQQVDLDVSDGFCIFTRKVWQLIDHFGPGAFYVFDPLTELQHAWLGDSMMVNFFQVICPRLYQADTVAYFALHAPKHRVASLASIRQTTQVLIDLHHHQDQLYIQPIKVDERRSPTMFLPHRLAQGQYQPIIHSAQATLMQSQLQQRHAQAQPLADPWDQLAWQAGQIPANSPEADVARLKLIRAMLGTEPKMRALAERYLSLPELLLIRGRTLGSGHIGGKALGMLLARAILAQHPHKPWLNRLQPHDSWYLATDLFYQFMVFNGLWPLYMRHLDAADDGFAQELVAGIMAGEMPVFLRQGLDTVLDYYGQYPLLVRSSSLLEDGFDHAFAGKYESIFVNNQGNPDQRLSELMDAIRRVYASLFKPEALHYRRVHRLDQHEEPMALLIQRVNGSYYQQHYMPLAAGVGLSHNPFAWDPSMAVDAGMVRLVMGLGTRAVDRIEGDHACVVALDQPLKRPYGSTDQLYRFSQNRLDLLDIAGDGLTTVSLHSMLQQGQDIPIDQLAEIDQALVSRARARNRPLPLAWRLTFQPLLVNTDFVEQMQLTLNCLQEALGQPVDIEFTLDIDEQGLLAFNLVQCRPMAKAQPTPEVPLPSILAQEQLLLRSVGHFMGGDFCFEVGYLLYVDPQGYHGLSISEKHQLAQLIGQWNQDVRLQACDNVLIGPGRWGSSSPELGVPVHYSHISSMRIVVEVADMGAGLVPDLSYGSHFFQDLVEAKMVYVAVFPEQAQCTWRPQWLDAFQALPLATHCPASLARCLKVYDLSSKRVRFQAHQQSQQVLCYAQAKPD